MRYVGEAHRLMTLKRMTRPRLWASESDIVGSYGTSEIREDIATVVNTANERDDHPHRLRTVGDRAVMRTGAAGDPVAAP
jgi:hypothetical protein